MKVLIVDDDAALLRTLGDIVALEGFASETASDAGRALTLAGEMRPPPALALVDLRLPDMDGLELVGRLRDRVADLQVLILTGNASVETAVRAMRDHCDYLVKPVQPDDLLRALGTAAGRWRLQRTTEDLQDTQALLQTVFRASPLALLVVEEGAGVRLLNPAAARLLGVGEPEAVGRPLAFGSPEDTWITEALEHAFRGRPTTGLETQGRRGDGGTIALRLSVAALPASSVRHPAALVVCEDLTERRRLEAHVQQAQRLDAVGRLAGGIAHDFNNLLAVIRTEADLARFERDLDPDTDEAFASIIAIAERGATLTRQLLSFARRQPMERAVSDPNEVVTDLMRMLERIVGERLRLETRLAPEVGGVEVDRGQLEQVLTNLVVNARDATPSGGTVTIETHTSQGGEGGGIEGLGPGRWVILTVRDTGAGIPEELRSVIFEPFFTTKERTAGTGLGLATSYGIVRDFGGVITVDSRVGQGSAFHVCLPQVPLANLPHQAGAVAGESGSGTETILLVEDHAELRSATKRSLERLGYTVHVAGTAEEALRLVGEAERPPDLILVDAHLPDADGRDLIDGFHESFPGVKPLLTSGSFEIAGRDDVGIPFLEKPYTIESLARAVRTVLDASRPDRAG